jgi:hypothetical protein
MKQNHNVASVLENQTWERSKRSMFHAAARLVVLTVGAFTFFNLGLPFNIGETAYVEAGFIALGILFYLFPAISQFGVNPVTHWRTHYMTGAGAENIKSKLGRRVQGQNSKVVASIEADYPQHKNLLQDIAAIWKKSGQSNYPLDIVVTSPRFFYSPVKRLFRFLSGGRLDLSISTLDFNSRGNYLMIPREMLDILSKEEIQALAATRIANLQFDHDRPVSNTFGSMLKFSTNIVIATYAMLAVGWLVTDVASVGAFVGGFIGEAGLTAWLAAYFAKGLLIGATVKAANTGFLGAVERQEEIVNDTRAVQLGIDASTLLSAHRKLALAKTGQDPANGHHEIQSPIQWHWKKLRESLTANGIFSLTTISEAVYLSSALFSTLSAWANPQPSYTKRRDNLVMLGARERVNDQFARRSHAMATPDSALAIA